MTVVETIADGAVARNLRIYGNIDINHSNGHFENIEIVRPPRRVQRELPAFLIGLAIATTICVLGK